MSGYWAVNTCIHSCITSDTVHHRWHGWVGCCPRQEFREILFEIWAAKSPKFRQKFREIWVRLRRRLRSEDTVCPNFANSPKFGGRWCVEIKTKFSKEIWAASGRNSCLGQVGCSFLYKVGWFSIWYCIIVYYVRTSIVFTLYHLSAAFDIVFKRYRSVFWVSFRVFWNVFQEQT